MSGLLDASGAPLVTPRAPRVLDTAFIFEGPGGSVHIAKAAGVSQQLPEDPFTYKDSNESGLRRPLYDMDQLARTLEGNSIHARAVRQKAQDILGRGIELRAKDPDAAEPGREGEDRWGAFLESVVDDERGDETFKERITYAHEDFEGIGWAVLEVGRNPKGELDGLWYVPGHTVRAHVDGRRFAQKRNDKTVWFKRYGIEGSVASDTGAWSPRSATGVDGLGNELIVIRNHTPRSELYGAPDHIPALAAIAGWGAQAMWNVRFFDNQAVPSYAVIIEGATLSPALEATIIDHFRQIKGDPARTIVIPIPGIEGAEEALQPKLRFERLSVEVKEASFRLYKQDNALEICIAHGIPPYRVGWPVVGSLGGNVATEMTRIYLDAVVQTRQETWEQRLTRALLGPKGLQIADRVLKCNTLDERDELRDLQIASLRYQLGAATPNSILGFLGEDQRTDPGGEAFIAVPLAPSKGVTGAPVEEPPIGVVTEEVAKRWLAEVTELTELRKRLEEIAGLEVAA